MTGKEQVSELPSYGYRRVWGLLRREREVQSLAPINVKRVYRVTRLVFNIFTSTKSLTMRQSLVEILLNFDSLFFGQALRARYKPQGCFFQMMIFLGASSRI